MLKDQFSLFIYRRTTMPKMKYESPGDSKKKKSKSDIMPTDEDDEIVVEIPGDRLNTFPGTPSCR